MKLILKILIPVLVICGILVLVSVMRKTNEEFVAKYSITPDDFKASANWIAEDSIRNMSIDVAMSNYNALYNRILVESEITSFHVDGDTSKLLDAQVSSDCYEDAFNAYWSVFGAMANEVFSGSEWDENDLAFIKNESLGLKAKKGSDKKVDSLEKYIQYVEGYHTALQAFSNAQNCKTAIMYEDVVNKVKKYNVKPYTNCSKLKNNIAKAIQDARKSWGNNIKNYVKSVCSKKYSSYRDFKPYQDAAYRNIKIYKEKTGQKNWGQDLAHKLDSCQTVLLYNHKSSF